MVKLQQSAYKVENLNLLAQQAVEGYIIGLHKSPFHGFSIEFSEHRLYNHGDSLRHIDWKVYGKSDKLFIKKYEEETNLRCCIAIDTSGSMYIPNTGMNKLQASGIAAASLLHILKKQLDAAAICYFDEQVNYLSEFKSTSNHYNTLIEHLERKINQPYDAEQATQTSISRAIHVLANRLHRKSLVIIFSDFLVTDSAALKDTLDALQHLKFGQHEIILFHIVDIKHEVEFDLGFDHVELIDAEYKTSVKIHTSDVKKAYQENIYKHLEYIKNECIKHHISYEFIDMNVPVNQVLQQYLQKRIKLM